MNWRMEAVLLWRLGKIMLSQRFVSCVVLMILKWLAPFDRNRSEHFLAKIKPKTQFIVQISSRMHLSKLNIFLTFFKNDHIFSNITLFFNIIFVKLCSTLLFFPFVQLAICYPQLFLCLVCSNHCFYNWFPVGSRIPGGNVALEARSGGPFLVFSR